MLVQEKEWRYLEEKGYVEQGSSKKKHIEIKDMPKPMQQLKAEETEHLLCSMKDSMTHLDIEVIIISSAKRSCPRYAWFGKASSSNIACQRPKNKKA